MISVAVGAYITAVAALVAAVGGVIALIRHITGPAHKPGP